MSVGVCIINRNGIALAADSAGTYTGNKMFYNSMNKVFSLSRKYTYGVITYGSTAIYNVSVDQILKEFRLYLDSKDYIKDFFEILSLFEDFIKTNNSYYKFDIAEKNYCNELIKELVVNWGNKIKSVALEEEAESKIGGILNELSCKINESLAIDNYDVSTYINATYTQYFNMLIGIVVPELNNFPTQKEELWRHICNYFNLSLTNETNHAMGLFFAGYGCKDAFPKFVHIELYKTIGGKIKYRLIENYEESNNHAKIVPLAQGDVILTFCKGISNNLINYIPQKASSIITSKIDSLPERYTIEQKNELKNIFNSLGRDISTSIESVIQNTNVKPILDSVQLIPLPEMAFLAESLVNITSLKRTYAIDGNQQTVGGPTDVAVMSKGDGFIWIKRKLYFDSQINPQYILNLDE